MNKFKLLALFFASMFLGMIGYISLAYTEYVKVINYGELTRELGHKVLEQRDVIAGSTINGISNPYEISACLVDIEKDLQQLHQSYAHSEIHSLLFNELETKALLESFYYRSMETVDQLDHIVGHTVARQFMLQSLTDLLMSSSPKGSHNTTYHALLSNTSALEAYLAGDNSSVTPQGATTSIEPLLSAETIRLAKTFNEVNQQHQKLLSHALSPEHITYLDHIEHGFMDLQDYLSKLIANLTTALVMLLFALFISIAVWRYYELKANTEAYQIAADKAEKANNAKSLFLATMSHELRTPMNGVLGIAQIIKDDSKELDTRKQAQVIIDSGQHLVTILNDILDFSKVEQGKMELESSPFTIPDLVIHLDKTLTSLAEDKGIKLLIKNNVPENIQLIGDQARTRQILFNLAGNAVKFTETGKVELEFNINDTSPPSIEMLVSDTGIGIAEDKIDTIFSAFEQAELSTTRKFGGTGLGLSIVKQLVELMGGNISVFSQLNVGTQFAITIPFELEEVEHQQQQTTTEAHGLVLNNFTVLLVEDNKINAMVIKKFCESLDLSVDNAYDGLQALDKLKQQSYDLVIMDNHMPKMSGIEAIRNIRQELKLETVIFACTADVFKEAHDEFIECGANFVLTKPLQKNSLQNAIYQFEDQFQENRERHACDNEAAIPSNVTRLIRYPKDKLPMTEEELSRSELLSNNSLSYQDKIDCLQSLEHDLEVQIDALIEVFTHSQPQELGPIIQAIKGVSSEFNMSEILALITQAEQDLDADQMPPVELLQQTINRLMVNSHQAKRLIDKYQHQLKTG
ncbi:response regulator [Vibrio sp. D404a]|uniref:ATP-binding protein n=1 Tax=unclassified Vibrio TaxID=2614977 RepID=UPI002556778E|nr:MULTISPECIES: ATP-binding protein [unclassified Vibrio]MDK9738186.1 response regulator [Vibrio sp. D404a]MDK9796477.1 response regulator [Vibrio sp. D449a]